MCHATVFEVACHRCSGVMVKDQVPGPACAEATANGWFGTCDGGVARQTQRRKAGEAGPEPSSRYLQQLLRDERLCAGCEIDDEIRALGLDADSAALDPFLPREAGAEKTKTDKIETGDDDDELEILPFWVQRAHRGGVLDAAAVDAVTLRGGAGYDADDEHESESEANDDGSDDDEDTEEGGAPLNDDDDEDTEEGGAKV